jgi:hypothetical protein
MGGPSREPWIKLKIGFRRSDKLALLPSDSARLGWVYAMLEGKVQRKSGVFVDRLQLIDLLGRFSEHFDGYVGAGLLEIEPELCAECAHWYPGLKPGQVVIHDFAVEQRDPTNADRQATWRDRNPEAVSAGAARTARYRLRQAVLERDAWTCRYCGRDDYERDWLIAEHIDPTGPSTLENLATACRSCNKLKGGRTPEEAGLTLLPVPVVTRHGDGSHGDGDASREHGPSALHGDGDESQRHGDASRDASHSRARGTTATVTDGKKKNVLDETVVVGAERGARLVEPATDLSVPREPSRPNASPATLSPRRLSSPVLATPRPAPGWRHPCLDYVHHQSKHRIEGGQAVCDACEAALALAKPAAPVATDGLGL